MSVRKIDRFQAFQFQPDFSPPAETATPAAEPTPAAVPSSDDVISVPVMELAALGAQIQAEAAAVARAPIDEALAARLEQAAEKLTDAVTDLSELASALDLAARMGQVPPALVPLAETAAQRLVDGQGDLFAACKALSDKS